MRQQSIVKSVTGATTSPVNVLEVPRWAQNVTFTIYGDDETDSTQSSFAFKLFACSLFPGVTTGGAAVTITDTTVGSSTQSEVQTVTFNGNASLVPPAYLGPFGSFALTFPDATVTSYIPFEPGGGFPGAQKVQNIINADLARAKIAGNVSVAAVGVPFTTASVTQTIYTITYGGGALFALTDVAMATADVTGMLLPIGDTATNFMDWDGTTAVTTQSTSEYAHIMIGPGNTGIADEDTAHTYKLNGVLPSFFAYQPVLDVTTDTACTYTYQIVADWTS